MTGRLGDIWLSELADALGCVDESGAPLRLNWSEVLQAIRVLRAERDELLAQATQYVGVRNGRNGESQDPSGRNQPDTDC
jgi:hypothetical protein